MCRFSVLLCDGFEDQNHCFIAAACHPTVSTLSAIFVSDFSKNILVFDFNLLIRRQIEDDPTMTTLYRIMLCYR